MPVREIKNKKLKVKGEKVFAALSVPAYSLAGRASGTLALPKDIFGAKINPPLLAQAVRVYQSNQKTHFSHTKTRSEVQGSTRKIWSQKGTGRARHGARTAPIFIGGGKAMGAKFRKVVLDLPEKMKKAALVSALSEKFTSHEVVGLVGLEKATGKTKQAYSLIKRLTKQSVLILTGTRFANVAQAVRNLPKVSLLTTVELNAFEVIKHQTLMITREAVEKLEERMKGKQIENSNQKGDGQLNRSK